MHGHSRMTIDPRILIMPGWSTSGFTNQADEGGGGERGAGRAEG